MKATQQPSANRIRLKGHEPISETTIHGWPALAFGGLFAVMGLPILGIGIGIISYSEKAVHAPLWVIGICGGLFSGGGIWLMLHGAFGLRRIWNVNKGKRQLPNSPWLWDYDWRAQGASDHALKNVSRGLLGLAVFGIFLAPFNWLAFFSKYSSWIWQVFVGLFDVIIIVGVGGWFSEKLRQYMRFGNSHIGFNNFPFFLGDTMSLTLRKVPRKINSLQFVLRCIEEAYETQGTGEDRKSVVVCYQIYNDSKTIDVGGFQPGRDYHLSWNLPDNKALSSTPSERPATFWELEVTSNSPGIKYQSRFLLPVYAPQV